MLFFVNGTLRLYMRKISLGAIALDPSDLTVTAVIDLTSRIVVDRD